MLPLCLKEHVKRLEQQRSRVLSINIIAGMDDSSGSELDLLNTRWEKAQEDKVRYRSNLQASLIACADLDKQAKKLLDSVTAVQLEMISGTTDSKVRLAIFTLPTPPSPSHTPSPYPPPPFTLFHSLCHCDLVCDH